MSTYWYMECTGHTPPLQSHEEFTQHTNDRAFKSALTLIANRPVQTVDFLPEDDSDAYFGRNARRFLRDHPTCRIEIVSEYGERRDGDGTNIRWGES